MKYVLFDLDGTLTDPGLGITNCVIYALKHFDIEPSSREELFPYIGPPLKDSFMNFHDLSNEQAEKALWLYRERFDTKGLYENELIEGIPELLKSLKNRGFKLIIATSKPEEYTVRILQHFAIDQYFDFVGGNNLREERPKKSDVIRYIMENHPDMSGENAIMVGDRKYDVEGAHEFGIPTIGVLFGYGSREELESAGADFVVKTASELENCLIRHYA